MPIDSGYRYAWCQNGYKYDGGYKYAWRTFVFTPECKYEMLKKNVKKPCILTSEMQMMLFTNAIKN